MRFLVIILSALFIINESNAFAQSSPNWAQGYIPSAPEWNSWWARKTDYNPNTVCVFLGCYTSIITNPNSVIVTGATGKPTSSTTSPSGWTLISPSFIGLGSGPTESANTVWAGPSSGSAATSGFRPLVAADFPSPLNLPGNLSVGGVLTILGSGTSLLGTDQTDRSQWGVPQLVVGISNQNAIIGETTNALTLSTAAFPAGTTGFGQLAPGANGNQAFGVYGLGVDNNNSGGGVTVGGEFTSRNLSGSAPDANLPPNTAIGTPTHVPDGVHVTCSTVANAKNCAVGVYVSNESGVNTDPVYSTGMFLRYYALYGLVIGSQSSGSQYGEIINSNGNGLALQMQVKAATNANNAVVQNLDNGSNVTWGVKQGGAMYFRPVATTGLPTCSSALEGEMQPVTDSTTATHGGAVTGGGGNHVVAYCNSAGQWVVLYP